MICLRLNTAGQIVFARLLNTLAVIILLLCANPGGISAADFNPVIYQTGFEASEGFTQADLSGQTGWCVSGIGQCAILTNYIAGHGQQPFIGYSAPATNRSMYTYAWKPLSLTVVPTNGPLRFSVSMDIVDSDNGSFDNFAWGFYDDAEMSIFQVMFDNSNQIVWWHGVDATNWVNSGITFSKNTLYTLSMIVDVPENKWSAKLNDRVVTSNRKITSDGRAAIIADIDAVWWIRNPAKPGNNYMLFDDYSVVVDGFLPNITRQPAAWMGLAGDTCELSVACDGQTPFSYQWWFNGTNRMSNSNPTNLLLSNIQFGASGEYSVTISNDYGSVTSQVAQVTVLASPVIYQTGFEVSEGYSTLYGLHGQNGWFASGPGDCGVVSNYLAGKGQQVYIGYNATVTNTQYLETTLWRNLSIPAVPMKFSATMGIVDSSTAYYDEFRWGVYDNEGNRLFVFSFLNSNQSIWYASGTNAWIDTGVSFTNNTMCDFNVVLDMPNNRWSASLGNAVLATNQVITAAGKPSGIGYIKPSWYIVDAQNPGDNYMLIDDYKVALLAELPALYTVSLSASPSNGGTVSGAGTFTAGSRTVTATANRGYTFANWTENGMVVDTNASYTFTQNANRSLVANFREAVALEILAIAMTPTRLTISSELGVTNAIEFADELATQQWQHLTNFLVTKSPYVIEDRNATASSHRYYRVVVPD